MNALSEAKRRMSDNKQADGQILQFPSPPFPLDLSSFYFHKKELKTNNQGTDQSFQWVRPTEYSLQSRRTLITKTISMVTDQKHRKSMTWASPMKQRNQTDDTDL